MLELRNVTKRYGDVTALDGVSLSVEAGETLGLVGTNGAGKTSLFRLLVGHELPDSGTVSVAGIDPTDGTRVRERVGYLPEQANFEPSLTAREVLRFHARMRGVSDADRPRRIARVLETVGLREDADRRVGGFSNGMTRRLGLATTLLASPQVLLLDEPTAGLDPQGVAAFNDVIERVRAETDVTVVVTTHVLSEVERLCDRVAIIDGGEIQTVGTLAEVRAIAGDRVTVTLTFDADADAAAVGSQFETDPSVTTTVHGSRVEATCHRDAVFDVLGRLADTDPATVEVSEPGLEGAFQRVLHEGTAEMAGDAT
ncbi:ABC transporter ATP-binding protein [Haloarculaceae archaeon H-GB2-1]|nr:ABC transporter ATP-binding protein [Haloarculaceae archaeon H-GB1-1]MEA5385754.1 ABC transporter ATP-binding protein [Haloarculaceae archaeon H-GB11]MEA5407258.1 ABC transporter ATP-binding protein [Haloarculaceae archaeon H-GB2-1]